MYIEFRLPSGAGGMAAGYTKQAITKRLKATCDCYNITIAEQVTQPYRFRVSFAQDSDYTLFALVWRPYTLAHNFNGYFVYKLFNEPIQTAYDPE